MGQNIQCPACKEEFEIELDIAVKTKGSTVFRGKMVFLGNTENIYQLLDFVRDNFKGKAKIKRNELIKKLVEECGVPHGDACHFIEKLKEEGLMYEPKVDELRLMV